MTGSAQNGSCVAKTGRPAQMPAPDARLVCRWLYRRPESQSLFIITFAKSHTEVVEAIIVHDTWSKLDNTKIAVRQKRHKWL